MKGNEDFSPATFENELNNILSWWSNNILHSSGNGFIGRIDGYGKKYSNAPIGSVFMTRILWAFSAAARNGYIKHFSVAEKAFKFILQHFVDNEHGGLYWMVDHKGDPLDKKKQTYAQAFGIYALSEYYLVTNNSEALYLAQRLFYLLEKKTKDLHNDGYCEAMTVDWQPMEEVRLSEKEGNDKKTMNTHLHVMESYTNLFRCGKDVSIEYALNALLNLYADKFIDLNSGRLKLFFDDKWNENFSHHSYGHEIESVWLMNEAAEVLGRDSIIQKIQQPSLVMAERVLNEGVDQRGSVYSEMSNDGRYDTNRDWWPQAEGVVGFYDAYQKTGSIDYLMASKRCWKFIGDHLIDKISGAWHWGVDSEGKINRKEDLAGPWIAPYHNSRMCIEMISRLNQIS